MHRSIGQGLSGAVKQACPRCIGKISTLEGNRVGGGLLIKHLQGEQILSAPLVLPPPPPPPHRLVRLSTPLSDSPQTSHPLIAPVPFRPSARLSCCFTEVGGRMNQFCPLLPHPQTPLPTWFRTTPPEPRPEPIPATTREQRKSRRVKNLHGAR